MSFKGTGVNVLNKWMIMVINYGIWKLGKEGSENTGGIAELGSLE